MIPVYMAVTNDEYEFPIALGDTVGELAKQLGVKQNTIRQALYRKRTQKIQTHNKIGYHIVLVHIPETDAEEELIYKNEADNFISIDIPNCERR